VRNIHIGYIGLRFGPWLLSREQGGPWIIDDGGLIGAVAYEPALRLCLGRYAIDATHLLVSGQAGEWHDDRSG